MLGAALAYARKGIPVFPVHSAPGGRCSCGNPNCGKNAGKHPRTANGFKDATCDERQIRQWWAKWPDANIGMPTGTTTGLLAIDADPRHGGDKALQILEEDHGTFQTTEVSTPGGGNHHHFRLRGVYISSSTGKLREGIDVRSEGGYVLLPPSVGPNGRAYTFVNGDKPADLPESLEKELLDLEKSLPKSAPLTPDEKIPSGTRNAKLASIAGKMRRPGMSAEEIFTALMTINETRCAPPLPESEVRAIANSIGKYEPSAPQATAAEATVIVVTGEYPRAADECEAILLGHAEELRLYQRAGELVRIIQLPVAAESCGLSRPEGVRMLLPLSPAALTEIWERRIDFEKPDRKGLARTNCPSRLVEFYLARCGEWKLPVLTGVISTPLVRPDGSVFSEPGYDPVTGLFLADSLDVSVPENPSIADAQAALEALKYPFREFPFVTEADRAVHLAAILTALERRVLGACRKGRGGLAQWTVGT
jgi:hypothetical protein